ncbi:hypothetical protein PBMFNG_PBMFNG_10100, partial [Dysosmobacter welbionis]
MDAGKRLHLSGGVLPGPDGRGLHPVAGRHPT